REPTPLPRTRGRGEQDLRPPRPPSAGGEGRGEGSGSEPRLRNASTTPPLCHQTKRPPRRPEPHVPRPDHSYHPKRATVRATMPPRRPARPADASLADVKGSGFSS